jgi:hypothetical protein
MMARSMRGGERVLQLQSAAMKRQQPICTAPSRITGLTLVRTATA